MNISLAHKRNKKLLCAGCGGAGDKLHTYFWNEYDFKYCDECLARRKKGLTPDWALVSNFDVDKNNSYLKSTDVMEGER